MKIILNLPQSSEITQEVREKYIERVKLALHEFEGVLSCVEIFLTDEDPRRDGHVVKCCIIRFSINERHIMSVINRGDTYNFAIKGAVDRIKIVLSKAIIQA